MKYVCTICGYIYDDAKEAVLFPDLPESWVCPLCGAGKSAFTTEQKTEVSETKLSPIQADEDMKKLSAGEFSALCSNLARGCEKQYKEAEAELFHEIADYFAEVTAPVENADVSELLKLLQADLNEGYPALFSARGSKCRQRYRAYLHMGRKSDKNAQHAAAAVGKRGRYIIREQRNMGMHCLWIPLYR